MFKVMQFYSCYKNTSAMFNQRNMNNSLSKEQNMSINLKQVYLIEGASNFEGS